MHTYIYGQCRRKKCHVCTGCARERHAPHSAAAATPLAVLEEQPAHLPRATRAHGALVRTASWCRLSPSKATTLLSRSSDGNAPSQPEVKKANPTRSPPRKYTLYFKQQLLRTQHQGEGPAERSLGPQTVRHKPLISSSESCTRLVMRGQQSTLPALDGSHHRRVVGDTSPRATVRPLAPNKRVAILNKPLTARDHTARLQAGQQQLLPTQPEHQGAPNVPPLHTFAVQRNRYLPAVSSHFQRWASSALRALISPAPLWLHECG